ncbi:MAG: ABC transporter substrate-binding protein [Deltaproteobacteria bacterium]|nr:ABC transporter substrate-binding protein [Deltaproteobacteria bacterium]
MPLVGCGGGGKRHRPARLTLYCGAQLEWCELASAEFERETGVRVSMTRRSSGETLAQLWAERRNPRGDVWWGGTGDGHIQAAEAKLLEPYRSPRLGELHEWAVDPEGRGLHHTTGAYMGALSFAYNRDWLGKKGLDAPRSWADLAKPAYRGEIQMANPASSGTAYTVLATIVQLLGEDRGFAYLEKLDANVNQYTSSGAAPVRAAARGETAIAIVFLHDAVVQKSAGFPIEVVLPSEGTGYEIGCASIIRGARHPDSARRFVDWILGSRAQELGARARSYQWPSNRSARAPALLPPVASVGLIPFDMGRFGSKRTRARLLSRWERQVRGGAR